MHGDERSPTDMDCDVTLPRGTQTEMLPTWGLAVCLHTRNGSQQHGACATGGRSVPCKHCGLTRRRSPVGVMTDRGGQCRMPVHARFASKDGVIGLPACR